MEQGKKTYINNLKKYHLRLQNEVLQDRYNIHPTFFNVMSWGYNTSAIYVEDKTKKYVLKLTNYSPERNFKILNDIKFCNILKNIINTSDYLKDSEGNQLSRFEDKMIRVSKFIPGTQALDVNYHILSQSCDMLSTIHKLKIVHGDVTPNNILVSYGEVTAIIDFENAEYSTKFEKDLAKMLFFCWDKMYPTEICEVFGHLKESYKLDFDSTKVKEETIYVIRRYILDVERNKEKYQDKNLYSKELELAKEKLKKVQSSILEC